MAERSGIPGTPRLCKECSAPIINTPTIKAPFLLDKCLDCHHKAWSDDLPMQPREIDAQTIQPLMDATPAASNGFGQRFILTEATETDEPAACVPARAGCSGSASKKIWKSSDYLARDSDCRRDIELALDGHLDQEPVQPNDPPGRLMSYGKQIALLRRALNHSSPAVRMNFAAIEAGISRGSYIMDMAQTEEQGSEDPEVDIVATRFAKLRFIEFLVKEAESLKVKDMQNLIAYMGRVLGWTGDYYDIFQRRAGFREFETNAGGAGGTYERSC